LQSAYLVYKLLFLLLQSAYLVYKLYYFYCCN